MTTENYTKFGAVALETDQEVVIHGLTVHAGGPRSSDLIGTRLPKAEAGSKVKKQLEGLKVEDVKINRDSNGVITDADVTYKDRKNRAVTKALKVPQSVAEALDRIITLNGLGPKDRVFHDISIGDNYQLNKVLQRLQARAGIPKEDRISSHGFRGTSATEWLRAGDSPARLAYELGDDLRTVFKH
jgi:hypothetical protein